MGAPDYIATLGHIIYTHNNSSNDIHRVYTCLRGVREESYGLCVRGGDEGGRLREGGVKKTYYPLTLQRSLAASCTGHNNARVCDKVTFVSGLFALHL